MFGTCFGLILIILRSLSKHMSVGLFILERNVFQISLLIDELVVLLSHYQVHCGFAADIGDISFILIKWMIF